LIKWVRDGCSINGDGDGDGYCCCLERELTLQDPQPQLLQSPEQPQDWQALLFVVSLNFLSFPFPSFLSHFPLLSLSFPIHAPSDESDRNDKDHYLLNGVHHLPGRHDEEDWVS
jgi:hypothetical protein